MNALNALRLLFPEVMLCALTFAILLLDILLLRKEPVERRHEVLGIPILISLGLIFVAYGLQLGAPYAELGKGAFVLSQLNTFFKMVVVVLAFVTIFVGLQTPYSSHVGEYYALVLFSVIGMVFLISSEELLMIFVALELLSLTLYALTAFQKGARRSVEGGLKYFIFGGLSAAFLLFGLSYIYGATGTTSLREISEVLQSGQLAKIPMGILQIGILFTLVGLGFKIAAVPFHLWAPDAYEGAPTPVAALIATGSKVASFFVLSKLFLGGLIGVAGHALGLWNIVEWKSGWVIILAVVAVLSMVLGNFAAIAQKNVKRLLAYSSIAHAGYILVAMVAVNSQGVSAEMSKPAIYFYVLIYALTNVGAFGVVNAIASKAGGDDFEHFTGMARKAPFLSLLMLIFMLSLAGIPPLAGFFGKFYLFAAAIQADPQELGLLWLVVIAIAMSAVSLYYYLKLLKQMYVVPAPNSDRVSHCPWVSGLLGLVALLVVLLGIFPSRAIDSIKMLQRGAITTQEAPMVPQELPTD
jgi:NADH-quinone oxidoreductase subunit N